ncbi:MAG TPA: hypothetical protein VF933_33390 [Streptosporangiaceae bacterium]
MSHKADEIVLRTLAREGGRLKFSRHAADPSGKLKAAWHHRHGGADR